MASYRKELELIPYNRILDYGLVLYGNDIVTTHYGFCNRQKEMVIGCIYDYARPFSEGLAAVRLNGKWGFINEVGKVVVPCQYFDVGDFSDGMALVGLLGQELEYDDEGNAVRWEHMYGYINSSGVVDISLEYAAGTEFREGYAFVNTGGETELPNKPFGGEWHKIDKHGNQLSTSFQFYEDYYVYNDMGDYFEYDFFLENYVWAGEFESKKGYEGYTNSALTADYVYPEGYADETKGFKRVGKFGWKSLEDGIEYWEVKDVPPYKHPRYKAIKAKIREENARAQEYWEEQWENSKIDFEDMADEDDEMRDMDDTDPTWRIANDLG